MEEDCLKGTEKLLAELGTLGYRGSAKKAQICKRQLGPWKQPVAYLSKKLDPVATGWPACLKIIATAALLVKDADKLTLGQNLTVTVPHVLESIIRQPLHRWLTNARITHYQALLLNSDRVTFSPLTSLNPATLLPDPDLEPPVHDCQQVLAEAHGWRKDLTDLPFPDAEATWFTDGSSYLDQGKHKAGAAVVDGEKMVWAQPLPEGTLAQKSELIALTRALELGSGKKINIYTDSRYAFATAHVHGAIYQQRGLLTSKGREIKNKPEITALLEALHKPAKVESSPGSPKGSVDPTKTSLRARYFRIQLIPRLIYHSYDKVLSQLSQSPPRVKREPVSLTISLLLGLGLGAVGVATGASSLVLQNQHYNNLREAIDADLEEIEQSISTLQDSLTSLSE
ncbi:uncharacterized protein LOC130679536 [Manis pentadactyla]|uniref:uncharacterized protein LOC130679536 n=1 Tax=Manis pentadactyla TaxID=143292 RepID=UPI00255CD3B4|nr:uncharacterized protein LOC130679536 [Manis pentadactyla]